MMLSEHNYSTVTAVLPNSTTSRVAERILHQAGAAGAGIFSWKARGTLLHDHWLKRWFPPISPAKTMLHMLVPETQSSTVVRSIVEQAQLHKQATGAVFSSPCERTMFGSAFQTWPSKDGGGLLKEHTLTENLSVIYCIVAQKLSDRVARAAITVGGHGPIVYYCEGRGLRDRLGWLRITKEQEKEVLMVITDEADADNVFNAMAKAGELHLPGRGFMYRMLIDQGIFNLPSRASNPHYAANMQQIINAIDHLSGHSHWRDQSVFDVGSSGRGVGLDELGSHNKQLTNQVCLSVISAMDDAQHLLDCMLDTGAPGVNFSTARYNSAAGATLDSGARLTEEYNLMRCITSPQSAELICEALQQTGQHSNACVFTNAVPNVATYVPGEKDYRDAA